MSLIHEALKKAGQSDIRAPRPGGRMMGTAGGDHPAFFGPVRAAMFAGAALLALAVIWLVYAMIINPQIQKSRPTAVVHEITPAAGAKAEPGDDVQAVVETDPESGLNAKGMEAFTRGDFKNAASFFLESLVRNPDQRVIRNNLGLALKKAGDTAGAEREYRSLIRQDAADHRAFNNLGVLLEETGRETEAIDSYLKALKIKYDYADAHLNLALLLEQRGKRAEALIHYRQFLDHAGVEQYELAKEVARYVHETGLP